MRRILLRSNFQLAIVSLSFFARRSRETGFRLPLLVIFTSISVSMLRPGVSSVEWSELITVGLTHVVSCLTASLTESLMLSDCFPFNSRPRAIQTSAQTFPSSTQSALLIDESCTIYISLRSFNTDSVERPTLIIVRIRLKELKTALAGVMLQASFATFDTSMAALSEERAAPRRFCR